ncbi:MAG: hypothetical protein N2606_03950 [Candidatus Omnitrophica bacterium]|nr:hypothetical protein [Candidatus Omnitrophota bacterium]
MKPWRIVYFIYKIIFPKISFPVRRRQKKLRHILLCIVDHFEPGNGNVSYDAQIKRVNTWVKCYPEMAKNFTDFDGRHPQHTWFYPPHYDISFLKTLVQLCSSGFGEIEMHLHHNRMLPFPDTGETLKKKILSCINDYSKYGVFTLPNGKKTFAFVHGDWSLDNSRGKKFCGVNNEIVILKECGCYADFTFPCLNLAQPLLVNTIYYAKDNHRYKKSYTWGRKVEVGKKEWGDLMIVQGILAIRRNYKKGFLSFQLETSDLDSEDSPSIKRIDFWIKNAITIGGKDDWLIIKLHTHGAIESSWDVLFGEKAFLMHKYLRERYNDGENFCLHYVTARELFNIIKAAEAGRDGNPNLYRDYVVAPYVYLVRNL